MSRNHPSRIPRREAVIALVGLEARALRRNRTACAVLTLAVIAAISLRLGSDRLAELGREACYVVYWERDAWVERLEAAAGRDNPERLAIRVVHVAELADAEGTIRYPPGAHSIQLRPTGRIRAAGDHEPTWPISVGAATDGSGLQGNAAPEAPHRNRRWTIWFWHSGGDPAALWPYSQWFWRVTAEHFGRAVEFEQRVSPLRPEAAIAGRTLRLTLAALAGPESIEIALVWTVVLFTACHLAGQSLAEERASRAIESVVVTPAGWSGASLAKRLFYGGLAAILGAILAAVLHPAALATGAFWLGLASAILAALGVGFVAGSRCRSVTAAGVASVLYVTLAGALFVGAEHLSAGSDGGLAGVVSFERSLLGVWQAAWGAQRAAPVIAIAGLVLWAGAWQALGAWSYRRLRNG